MKKTQPMYSVQRSKKNQSLSWPDADKKHLKEIAGTMPVEEIAKIFGRKVNAVISQCSRQYLSYKYVEMEV